MSEQYDMTGAPEPESVPVQPVTEGTASQTYQTATAPQPAPEGPLHAKLREGFTRYLGAAAIVGLTFALTFTDTAWNGVNALIFTAVLIACTAYILKGLGAWPAGDGVFCCAGMALLAGVIPFTMNGFVQLVSGAGIVVLLAILLLSAFGDMRGWYFGKLFGAGMSLFFGALVKVGEPVTYLWRVLAGKKAKKPDGKAGYVLMGLAIALPLAIFVSWLLALADSVFADVLGRIFDLNVSVSHAVSVIIEGIVWFAVITIFFYALISRQTDRPVPSDTRELRQWESVVAVTFTAVLLVIYAVFCFIQIRYLFAGLIMGDMKLPGGTSYAQYAREGFFQLLFVSALNGLIVLRCTRRFGRGRALQIILTAICACTYIMMLSSALRMTLYVQTYGLTFLRILVWWFLAVLAILMGAILVFIYRPGFPLLRFFVAVGLASWLILAYSRPDRLSVLYNNYRFGEKAASLYRPELDGVGPAARLGWFDQKNYWESGVMREIESRTAERDLRAFNIALDEAAGAMKTG